jgi:hypothetical protein
VKAYILVYYTTYEQVDRLNIWSDEEGDEVFFDGPVAAETKRDELRLMDGDLAHIEVMELKRYGEIDNSDLHELLRRATKSASEPEPVVNGQRPGHPNTSGVPCTCSCHNAEFKAALCGTWNNIHHEACC